MTKHQKAQVNFAKIGLSGPPKKIRGTEALQSSRTP